MSNHCVDTRGKWFKDLAKKLNLRESSLDDAIHLFQNQRDTTEIPTEQEILDMFEGINTQYSDEALTVWAAKYTTPIVLNNQAALDTAKAEALEQFPAEAVSVFPTIDGKFVLRVAKPENPNAPIIDNSKLSDVRREGFSNELDKFMSDTLGSLYGEIEVHKTDQRIVDLAQKTIEDYRQEYPDAVKQAQDMTLAEAYQILDKYNRKTAKYHFQLSKSRRLDFQRRLGESKAIDYVVDEGELIPLLPVECAALLKFMDTLNDKKHEDAVFRWYMNGTINVAEDKYKIDYALELIDEYKVNPKDFKSPMEVINAFPSARVMENRDSIIPGEEFEVYRNCPYLSNETVVGDCIVYDVEDSPEAAKYISEHIIAKYFDQSPWCIFKFSTETDSYGGLGRGEKNVLNPLGSGLDSGRTPIWNGQMYWNNYSFNKHRKIAINAQGIPVFMNASSHSETEWWDHINDAPTAGPGAIRYEATEDGRTKVIRRTQAQLAPWEYTPRYSEEVTMVFKGSQADGEYIEFTPDGKTITKIQNKKGRRLHGRQWDSKNPNVEEFYEMGKKIKTVAKTGAFTLTTTHTNTPYEENGHVQYRAEPTTITIDKGNSSIEALDINNLSIQDLISIETFKRRADDSNNIIVDLFHEYYSLLDHYKEVSDRNNKVIKAKEEILSILNMYNGSWESLQTVVHDMNYYSLPTSVRRVFHRLRGLPIEQYSVEEVLANTNYKSVAQFIGHVKSRIIKQINAERVSNGKETGSMLKRLRESKAGISVLLTAQAMAESNSVDHMEAALQSITGLAQSRKEEIAAEKQKRAKAVAKRIADEQAAAMNESQRLSRNRDIRRTQNMMNISRTAAALLYDINRVPDSDLDALLTRAEGSLGRGSITREEFDTITQSIGRQIDARERNANTDRAIHEATINAPAPVPVAPAPGAPVQPFRPIETPTPSQSRRFQEIAEGLQDGTVTMDEARMAMGTGELSLGQEVILRRTLSDMELPFQLEGVDENEFNVLGVSNLKAMSILIDVVRQKQDTLPHEYAHHYIGWYRHTDVVQQAIKDFGSEEALVQAIGENVVKRAKTALEKKQQLKARTWWKKICDFILNIFNKNNRQLEYLTDAFLERKALSDQITFNDGTEFQTENNINYGKEFRELQEASRGMSEQDISKYHTGEQRVDEGVRGRLSRVFQRQLSSEGSSGRYGITSLVGKGNTFKMYSGVKPTTFHDIFEVVRNYLPNGELVDLHDSYEGVKCYLSEDGLSGFAIEPNGNLISVFNLNNKKGFLYSIKDFIIKEGATHLDGYNSSKQPLAIIYEKALGWKTASLMDYNMEYDHDNIAEVHGSPQVAFMVSNPNVETKHFDKDSYDKAEEYQLSSIQKNVERLNIQTKDIHKQFNTKTIDSNSVEVEYAKAPWADDATKTKYSAKIYLKGQKDKGYFELVADTNFENTEFNGEYSIHFKTATEEHPTEGVTPSTTQEREVLYAQVLRMLPAGAKLSTWGELTPGGKYALEKLGRKLKTTDETRDAKLKNGTPIKLPVFQKPSNGQMTELEKFSEKQHAIKTQMFNLYRSTRISNVELGEVADNIVFTISNLITKIQQNPELVNEEFEDVSVEAVRKATTRAEIANAIGVEKLINYVKNIYAVGFNTNGEAKYRNRKTALKAVELANNWDAVMQLTVPRFNMVEQFTLVKDIVKEHKINDVPNNSDDFNTQTDIDAIREMQGDLQEAWQVDSKTISVVHSMTSELKSVLQGMPLLKITGVEGGRILTEEVKDSFGGTKHQALGKTTSTLLTWFEGVRDLADMIKILQQKAGDNPWVLNFLGMLMDRTGQYSNFQSEFFTTMYRPFNNLAVVRTDSNGKASSSIVNREKASQKVMQSIEASMNIDAHPLFHNGVVESSYNKLVEAKDKLQKFVDATDKNSVMSMSELHNLIGEISTILGFQPILSDIQRGVSVEDTKGMVKALDKICSILKGGINDATITPFKYDTKFYIKGYLKTFFTPITKVMQETTISSLYDSGKMYQSYVIPSYMSSMMNNLSSTDDAVFTSFVNKEFTGYEWFKKPGTGIESGWRHSWMRELVNSKDARKVFMHKTVLNMDKKNYMKNMNELEYAVLNAIEYFSEGKGAESTDVRQPSWYRVTILSNKPAAEYIRFYSERGSNYEDILVRNFLNVFAQELSRIQTVKMRNLKEGDKGFMPNWDVRGKEFTFLDFLNAEVENHSELGELIIRKTNGENLNNTELSKMADLAKQAIRDAINSRIANDIQWFKEQGLLDVITKKVRGLNKANAEYWLKNFLWNDAYAQTMILQLLTTDTAYYKNADDVQKRIAQVHAPGIRPNVAAIYSNKAKVSAGQQVSDGKQRSVILRDYKKVLSSAIANVEEAFDKKIAEAPEGMKEQWRAMKESAMDAYRNINVADAQAYCSMSAYRKKAVMFGKWNDMREDIYNRLLDGTYTFTDLRVAFQPLKPFMYSQNEMNTNVQGAPMSKHKSPYQNKNAEYLLILADAMTRTGEYSRPNLLRVLNDIMEESHLQRDANGKVVALRQDGIDTIEFESAVKVGGSDAIDLLAFTKVDSNNPNMDTIAKVEQAAKEHIIANIFNNYETHEYSEAVHESDYANYSIQQEVPEHFRNQSQAHGSQERYITVSDLETVDKDGNTVYYKVTDADGTTRQLTRDEFKQEYEETIAQNIREDLQLLRDELHLDVNSTVAEQKLALSKLIQEEVESSSRYGIDLWIASCIDDATGDFIIPLGDPIQSKRVEQLLNSVVKNRVNKQKLPGGPVVQVSNFGHSKRLTTRYKDILSDNPHAVCLTEVEWNSKPREDASYKEYLQKHQGGIAYHECYAPIPSEDFYDRFADEEGNIDIAAIEATDPDLLYMISNRIPTEDKYSIEVLKIVGFLPREAGEALILPEDITSKDGSDFDVDKRYCQLKKLPITGIKTKNVKAAMLPELVQYIINTEGNKGAVSKANAVIKEITNNKQDTSTRIRDYRRAMESNDADAMRHADLMAFAHSLYRKFAYTTDTPTSGRAFRDNKIIDMTRTIMQHPTQAALTINPQNIDTERKVGYAVECLRRGLGSWDYLMTLSPKQLKDKLGSGDNLMYLTTQIRYYKQNQSGSTILGMFAVQKIAHAALEGDGLRVDLDSLFEGDENKGNSINIAGFTLNSMTEFDRSRNDVGEFIGLTFGHHVGIAADTAKETFLDYMNINSTTANVFSTAIRAGIPYVDAALFLSSNVVSEMLRRVNIASIKRGSTMFREITEELKSLIKDAGGSIGQLATEELTRDEILDSISTPYSEIPLNTKIKILNYYQMLSSVASEYKSPTFATRFNSISNAVGPLIIDNLMTEYQIDNFSKHIIDRDGRSVDFYELISRHPILEGFHGTLGLAADLFRSMPTGSYQFRTLIKKLGSNKITKGIMNKIMSDRDILNKFSNFYLSYLLISSGAIQEKQLEGYITRFPKHYVAGKYHEKYPNNLFIQNTKLYTNSKGETFLNTETTGLENTDKEALISGWADLYFAEEKANKELNEQRAKEGKSHINVALDLFNYYFFRRGISYSPETGMGLLPMLLKLEMPKYLDTYRHLPAVDSNIVMDTFIRNNADNNTLVPFKGAKALQGMGIRMLKDGVEMVSTDETLIKNFSSVTYFKFKDTKGVIHLMRKSNSKVGVVFNEVSMLGNNGEYLEMSTSDIKTPMSTLKVTQLKPQTPSQEVVQAPEGDNNSREISAEEQEQLAEEARAKKFSEIFHVSGDPLTSLQNWRDRLQNPDLAKAEANKAFVRNRMKQRLQEKYKIEISDKQVEDTMKELNLC